MKKYVIQIRLADGKWANLVGREYDTIDKARAAFEKIPIRADYRIAEAYTVIRYKAVK